VNLVALMGLPGSGKSTLARHLVGSDGAAVRVSAPAEHLDEVASGRLVPDGVAFASISAQLAVLDTIRGVVVLDGFPRTQAQAALLTAWCVWSRARALVVVLDPPEDVRRARLHRRALVEGREDDAPILVDQRTRIHENLMDQAIESMRAGGHEVLKLSQGSPVEWAEAVLAVVSCR